MIHRSMRKVEFNLSQANPSEEAEVDVEEEEVEEVAEEDQVADTG